MAAARAAQAARPGGSGGMIDVVHLITGLNRGGAESMLAKLVGAMDRGRFRSVVVSMTGPGVLGPSLVESGTPVLSLGMVRGLPDPRGIARLVGVLRRYRPAVLQTWLYHADLLGTMAAAWVRRPKLVWNLRCSNMDMGRYSRQSAATRRLLAVLSGRPVAIIANSEAGRGVHERLGYHPRRWEMIPNGFDLERFRPDPAAQVRLRRELGAAEDAPLIGLPARFDPMKDHGGFLAAAAILAQRHAAVRFVLIGRGLEPGNPQIAGPAAAAGIIGRLGLLGERRDMEMVLAGLDIATLSSAFGEGFPNVLGEAMACGVPCVATDVGDAAELIGATGIIVPPRDPAALAAAWLRLLELRPEERARLGAAARQRIAGSYALPAIIARYEALYTGLAGAPAAEVQDLPGNL